MFNSPLNYEGKLKDSQDGSGAAVRIGPARGRGGPAALAVLELGRKGVGLRDSTPKWASLRGREGRLSKNFVFEQR